MQTGLANDTATQIVSGLQPGDKVVIAGTTTATTNHVPGLGGPGGIPGTG